MLKLLLIIILLIINFLLIKCMHQIDCETYLENNAYYGDNPGHTGCRDYVLEYLEAYLGILQNSNVPSNLPDQGYNQKQIPYPPFALYYDPPTTFHGNSYINNELDLAKKELSIAMCKNEMLNKKFNDMLLDEVLSSL